jgi:hypothetical protein
VVEVGFRDGRRICFQYSRSVAFLPARIFQNYIAHDVSFSADQLSRWVTRSSERFRCPGCGDEK